MVGQGASFQIELPPGRLRHLTHLCPFVPHYKVMKRTTLHWSQAALVAVLVLTPSANAVEAGRANQMFALVKLGPRVTGTPVMDKATLT